ncbi:TetR/AcrR family transcriptional regulator [Spongiibacter taiwanensis]|uniref:TetR/AcrR family transcriptional regulator n=1 Tax=Spongiibacter taiwanensis TaxID=1748242 RepID=UPI00203560E1|nr:TetR/AcrR family transcriptional regulator [Spongiibacter taiwanensis]USA42704.1 TetR/AcrR family transcriptional regulator [Spongiibacter taiwanensis]
MTVEKKKTRVPQAERTAIMRERLSKAAFEVIRDNGFANFRTSAVAKKAGVSQGAQLHHYPTKNDLTLAAMEYAYERSQQIFIKNIAAFSADEDPVEAAIKDAEDFYLSEFFMVALDILIAGGKNEELREQQIKLALNSRSAVEKAWIRKLIDLGWNADAAEDTLQMTFCLVRGYAIKLLITDNMATYDKMMATWKTLAAQIKAD